jgi:hypothetical protein
MGGTKSAQQFEASSELEVIVCRIRAELQQIYVFHG